ncbi:translation elongation factor Ts [mine drainage metagenome]|uniref:Translation elongation factor Ts n=1 Tax=mine drainage metagenome TaxID=410659 RepID=T0YMF8_9ZZZZ
MTEISAQLVRELRERTGVGFMECKKALVETAGAMEAALDYLAKAGLAKADRKSSRVAAEGRLELAIADGQAGALVEVNSETDFVASSGEFRSFAQKVAALVAARNPASIEELMQLTDSSGRTLDEERRALMLRLGENVVVRRFRQFTTQRHLAGYIHQGGQIGVLVEFDGGSPEVGRNIALQITASAPRWLEPSRVDHEWLAKQREIAEHQARESGKPPAIMQKIVEGRLKKVVEELSLSHQPYIKDPEINVMTYLSRSGTQVIDFVRYAVGKGIEKEQKDFAEEVMAQVNRR